MKRLSWPFVTPREIIETNMLMHDINNSYIHKARLYREQMGIIRKKINLQAGYFPPQPKKTIFQKVIRKISDKLYKAKQTAKAFWWG